MAFENPPPDHDPFGEAKARRAAEDARPTGTLEQRAAFYRARARRYRRNAALVTLAAILFVFARYGLALFRSDQRREAREAERRADASRPVLEVSPAPAGLPDLWVRLGDDAMELTPAHWDADLFMIGFFARKHVPSVPGDSWTIEFTGEGISPERRVEVSRALRGAIDGAPGGALPPPPGK